MVDASELKLGDCVDLDGQYFRIVSLQLVTAGGKAGSHYNAKFKNLKTGAIAEKHYKTTDKFKELDVIEQKKQYLYDEGENIVLMDPETFEQIPYPKKNLGKSANFLSENCEVNALLLGDQLLDVEVPQFMELKISQSAPGVHSGVYKPATLENGVEIQVPNFIKEGDTVKVDTHSGQYIDRVKN